MFFVCSYAELLFQTWQQTNFKLTLCGSLHWYLLSLHTLTTMRSTVPLEIHAAEASSTMAACSLITCQREREKPSRPGWETQRNNERRESERGAEAEWEWGRVRQSETERRREWQEEEGTQRRGSGPELKRDVIYIQTLNLSEVFNEDKIFSFNLIMWFDVQSFWANPTVCS